MLAREHRIVLMRTAAFRGPDPHADRKGAMMRCAADHRTSPHHRHTAENSDVRSLKPASTGTRETGNARKREGDNFRPRPNSRVARPSSFSRNARNSDRGVKRTNHTRRCRADQAARSSTTHRIGKRHCKELRVPKLRRLGVVTLRHPSDVVSQPTMIVIGEIVARSCTASPQPQESARSTDRRSSAHCDAEVQLEDRQRHA